MSMTLFDWLKELTGKKRDWGSFTDKEKESFNPYMVNRFLSMHQSKMKQPTTELVEALSKIYECSTREAEIAVITLDNDLLEEILYKAGYQDKEVIQMFK